MNLFHSYYDTEKKILYGTHNSGFYSCINCLRISLYKLISIGVFPDKLTLVDSLYEYKDFANTDIYEELYVKDERYIPDIRPVSSFEMFCPTLNKHGDLNLEFIAPIERAYFSPSDKVVRSYNRFITKYGIVPEKTLAILHRGNDKWKETKLVSAAKWIEVVESKLSEGFKILVQTDEDSFKNKMLSYFGDKCFCIEEMIFGNDYNHNIKPVYNKLQWCVNFDAVMRVISKCKIIINHTGNCALVPILYRGNLIGETQLFNNLVISY